MYPKPPRRQQPQSPLTGFFDILGIFGAVFGGSVASDGRLVDAVIDGDHLAFGLSSIQNLTVITMNVLR